ncbi:MAG: helix-turn-helix transcriptional regulator [Bacteroidetes bacterium]|nr:helix-turn-helix transcriptional regulator [Bacteroidota bacterium]
MRLDRSYTISKLKNVIDKIEFKNVIFTNVAVSLPDKKSGYIKVGAPRLLFPLSGNKELVAPIDNKVTTLEMQLGDIIFIPTNSWNKPLWTKSHTMISLTYYPTHIRILFIDYKVGNLRPLETSAYCHSQRAANQAGQSIIQALEAMAGNYKLRLKAEQLIQPLLELSLLDLQQDDIIENSKAYSTWCEVLHCIMENYHQPISCKYIAQKLCIDAGYVSKLLKKFAAMGFSEYLTQIRISHAKTMLKDSRMTLDEIAFSCGFNYTSYFIRVFQKIHGISPSRFRQND